MANSGKNTNRSQFFITFNECPHLNDVHSVFGRVVGGSEVLDAMENVPCGVGINKNRPQKDIKITDVTIYNNPFDEEFIPDEERLATKAEKKNEDTSQIGQWYSDPAKALSSSTHDASRLSDVKFDLVDNGQMVGKYLPEPSAPNQKSIKLDASSSPKTLSSSSSSSSPPSSMAVNASEKPVASLIRGVVKKPFSNFSNW